MANTYDIGDVVRVTGTFTVASVATDPTTVTLKVEDPSGNLATYTYALSEVTRSGVGVFYRDVSVDEKGVWQYEWIGTGACATAEEGEFFVRVSQVG